MFSPRMTEDLNVTYHRHTLDRLCLPRGKGRLELHVVVLQYAKAERANRVLRRQHPPVCQSDRDAQVGALECRHGRVEEHLRELEKLGGLCLDEVLDPRWSVEKRLSSENPPSSMSYVKLFPCGSRFKRTLYCTTKTLDANPG